MEFGKPTRKRKRRKTPLAVVRVTGGKGGAVQVRFSAEEASKLGLTSGMTLIFYRKRSFRATTI